MDVFLRLSLERAGKSDALEDTVDYAAVFRDVRAVVEGKPGNLIESLAERIAEGLLEGYPPVDSLRVTVHKPGAPLGGKFRDAAVTIERQRRT